MAAPPMPLEPSSSAMGPYKPTLILHGGAGNITRASLPPALYTQYHDSLLSYLISARARLDAGATAVDAACHAVSLMEDNPLFNCGRGSVFTVAGEIEMEASLMVTSVVPSSSSYSSSVDESTGSNLRDYAPGMIKRNAAVSMLRHTRHPILLARELLLVADKSSRTPDMCNGDSTYGSGNDEEDDFGGSKGKMQGHLSGSWVEECGFKRGLERKSRKWFWTRKRWEEHRRGLGKDCSEETWRNEMGDDADNDTDIEVDQLVDVADSQFLPSQGTVGAVCFDSRGNLCAATSTGGRTNKLPGRIGDTPTVGAGFWAESWHEVFNSEMKLSTNTDASKGRMHTATHYATDWLGCLLGIFEDDRSHPDQNSGPLFREDFYDKIIEKQPLVSPSPISSSSVFSPTSPAHPDSKAQESYHQNLCQHPHQRRAIALSGTGNGDSFLRTVAARTTASLCRLPLPAPPPHHRYHHQYQSRCSVQPKLDFQSPKRDATTTASLQDATTAVAGPHGLLQKSAGDRWGRPDGDGEGEGGIIGVEVVTCTEPCNSTDKRKSEGKVESKIVFDFNCGGMWRAYYEVVEVPASTSGNRSCGSSDEKKRKEEEEEERPRVMVFREEY